MAWSGQTNFKGQFWVNWASLNMDRVQEDIANFVKCNGVLAM